MFAWAQLLSHDLEHPEAAYVWLITVAIREALKLDRRSRRTLPLVAEHNEVLAVVDPNDRLRRTQLLLEGADVIQTAGVTSRQTRILGLQALGLSYEEIHGQTGDTKRTIERQIRSAQKARPRIERVWRVKSRPRRHSPPGVGPFGPFVTSLCGPFSALGRLSAA